MAKGNGLTGIQKDAAESCRIVALYNDPAYDRDAGVVGDDWHVIVDSREGDWRNVHCCDGDPVMAACAAISKAMDSGLGPPAYMPTAKELIAEYESTSSKPPRLWVLGG